MDKEEIESNHQLQEDEIIVLSSIYEEDIFFPNPDYEKNKSFIFKLPIITEEDIKNNDLPINEARYIELNVFLPDTYPQTDPPIYEIISNWMDKGVSIPLDVKYKKIISENFDNLWNELKGEVIIYEWVQYLSNYIETELKELLIQQIKKENTKTKRIDNNNSNRSNNNSTSSSPVSFEDSESIKKQFHIPSYSQLPIPKEGITLPEIFASGEPIVDRKSVFIAYLAPITHIGQVRLVMTELLKDKKIAKATHNMYAYRIEEKNGIINEGNDDDGEHGAGITLEGLLEVVDAKNVMVVVARWYGGIKLGPDRFKHIKDIALQILDEHGYVSHKNKKRTKDSKNLKKK